ncbi:hypothetical protein B0T26DRAFT_671565 [Lasiosphaeria miniovina]|uniref:Uncharacterized protein n=1 Tax=Lasiosphaeria miniovina TaxID=1954250 RepID=A0AA40E3M0_9PEZI|nr:uncharacterized protein B0T26DRAFT_671565 [Lasiosphaeria miniovina]KAK0726814.1 hypothetical protein B0T26DRAFT_671565 [Lasiosphaeria miniovina]
MLGVNAAAITQLAEVTCKAVGVLVRMRKREGEFRRMTPAQKADDIARIRKESGVEFRAATPTYFNYSNEVAVALACPSFEYISRCARCFYVANYKITGDPGQATAEEAYLRENEWNFNYGPWDCAESFEHCHCTYNRTVTGDRDKGVCA